MGVGVIASMAFECIDREDLVAIDAQDLFPRVTTWLGFPRDMSSSGLCTKSANGKRLNSVRRFVTKYSGFSEATITPMPCGSFASA